MRGDSCLEILILERRTATRLSNEYSVQKEVAVDSLILNGST